MMESNATSIAALLPKGEKNAVRTAELVRLAGVASSRELQLLISEERAAGALILSTSRGGYFLPDDGAKGRAEIEAYVRTLKARALNTLRILKPANRALKGLFTAGRRARAGLFHTQRAISKRPYTPGRYWMWNGIPSGTPGRPME